jgi:hypothetical protein
VNAYLALVHHPIINKRGDIVTTSVTNLDIHDIARSARTFGFDRYFIITPVEAQKKLVGRITDHWKGDVANEYNPDRQDALSFVMLQDSLEQTIETITEMEGQKPAVVATCATFKEFDGDATQVRNAIELDNKPMLLIFGTGWGLPASVTESVDYRVEPIFGNAQDGYNHLSVRSAVAIYGDRFFGGSL